jgi:putative SOS response-associated peptidase YedK
MCGTYIYFDIKAVGKRFNAKVDPQLTLEPRYNIKPGSVNPTVSQQSPNTVVLEEMGVGAFLGKGS